MPSNWLIHLKTCIFKAVVSTWTTPYVSRPCLVRRRLRTPGRHHMCKPSILEYYDTMDMLQDEVFVIPNLGFAAIYLHSEEALNLNMDSTRALVCKLKLVQHPAGTGVQAYTDRRVTRGSTEFTPRRIRRICQVMLDKMQFERLHAQNTCSFGSREPEVRNMNLDRMCGAWNLHPWTAWNPANGVCM